MANHLLKDEAFNLGLLLRYIVEAYYKIRERETNRYGISAMQSAVLWAVGEIGQRATPTEISRWIFRTPNGLSPLLNTMEKKGLVKRVKDLDRKNMVRIAITKKGHQIRSQAANREAIDRIMSVLSEVEQLQLRSLLIKLLDKSLEELGVERPPYPPDFSEPY